MSERATKIAEQKGIEGIIDHPRYKPTGRILGKGTWGTVYEAEDNAAGGTVAIKVLTPTPLAEEQMRHRQLTPWEVMSHEGDLAPCANIVPRSFEIDNQGKPFIRMPIYARFLDDILRDDLDPTFRTRVDSGMSDVYARSLLVDIAGGLDEMHDVKKRVHSDLKPDNIALDQKGYPSEGKVRALLNDLGTSTCASLGWAEGPRDNAGFVYTRAPEAFKLESHPRKESDVWSFGALAYRLYTGEYPLESELGAAEDPVAFMANMDDETLNGILDRKMEKVSFGGSQRLKRLVRQCLNADPHCRPYDGDFLLRTLNEALAKPDYPRETLEAFKKWGVPTAVTGLIAAAVVGGAMVMSTGSPSVRPVPRINGLLYLEDSGSVSFDTEYLRDLPKVFDDNMMTIGVDGIAKRSTSDRNVAYLASCYHRTVNANGVLATRHITDYQEDLFKQLTAEEENRILARQSADSYGPSEYWATITNSVEHNMSQLKRENGSVDLEDLCVASRVGVPLVEEAKRVAGSEYFAKYIDAKHPNGERVISEEESMFVKTWLAYIHKND